MRHKNPILAVLVLSGAPLSLFGQTSQTMESLLTRIAGYQPGDPHEHLALLTEFLQDSMGSREQLPRIEARMLQFIQSNATAAAKDFVLGQLSLLASNASIPVLLPLLTQAETAERARYVLARIPGSAADEALRQALGRVAGRTRIGVIGSLGQRRDALAVPALQSLLTSSDAETSAAAMDALAQIGNRPALDALTAARTRFSGPTRERAAEAVATCADQIVKAGDKAAAVRAYRELLAPQEPARVRIRALNGLVAAQGKDAIPALTAALHSKDRREQSAAMTFLNRIPGAEPAKVMTAEFPKLPAAGRIRVLAALADRGDPSARTLVAAALKDNSGDVRAAAFSALGQVGDGSSVTVLAGAAAERPAAEADAARQSLHALRGSSIDAAIMSALSSTTGKTKAELLLAVGERGMNAAADEAARALQDPDPNVRREALKALRNVGSAAQMPVVLDVLVAPAAPSDRREAVLTLSALVKRSQPTPVGALVSAFQTARAVETRASLLEVIGHTSDEQALPLLRTSITDPTPEISRAAILALTGWETSAPLNDLLGVATTGTNPAQKVLALRGYLRLLALPPHRPPADSARLLANAMTLATDPAEKRAVLALLPSYPCPESLEIAQRFLKDQAVATEAEAAANRLRAILKQR